MSWLGDIARRFICRLSTHQWMESPVPPHNMRICKRCTEIQFHRKNGSWIRVG